MMAVQESGRSDLARLLLAMGLLLLMAVLSLVCVLRDYKAVRDAPRVERSAVAGWNSRGIHVVRPVGQGYLG